MALVLWGSAQIAEATRGAVISIPHKQHEAAAALGFGWVGRHGYVILPQALRPLRVGGGAGRPPARRPGAAPPPLPPPPPHPPSKKNNQKLDACGRDRRA